MIVSVSSAASPEAASINYYWVQLLEKQDSSDSSDLNQSGDLSNSMV
ncbi:hypothetical protein [Shivajiella indica]|uniref:Uncharacterized protein n=1 Tax=Shivajiella indica TaxID=872115 RepID=A0ABW5B378_9BACT